MVLRFRNNMQVVIQECKNTPLLRASVTIHNYCRFKFLTRYFAEALPLLFL